MVLAIVCHVLVHCRGVDAGTYHLDGAETCKESFDKRSEEGFVGLENPNFGPKIFWGSYKKYICGVFGIRKFARHKFLDHETIEVLGKSSPCDSISIR